LKQERLRSNSLFSRHSGAGSSFALLSILVFWSGIGCGSDDEGEASLPPDVPTPTPTPTPDAPGDDDATASNSSPAHTLSMSDTGIWLLSPTGGPYDSIEQSSLIITDTLDGSETPSCELTYTLQGDSVKESLPSASSCPGCDYIFSVRYTLVSGAPGDCYRADLPQDQSLWNLGYSQQNGYVYYDYNGTGLWLPWYDAFRDETDADRIFLTWTQTVGITIDD
jgi:hypothetical protein